MFLGALVHAVFFYFRKPNTGGGGGGPMLQNPFLQGLRRSEDASKSRPFSPESSLSHSYENDFEDEESERSSVVAAAATSKKNLVISRFFLVFVCVCVCVCDI